MNVVVISTFNITIILILYTVPNYTSIVSTEQRAAVLREQLSVALFSWSVSIDGLLHVKTYPSPEVFEDLEFCRVRVVEPLWKFLATGLKDVSVLSFDHGPDCPLTNNLCMSIMCH